MWRSGAEEPPGEEEKMMSTSATKYRVEVKWLGLHWIGIVGKKQMQKSAARKVAADWASDGHETRVVRDSAGSR